MANGSGGTTIGRTLEHIRDELKQVESDFKSASKTAREFSSVLKIDPKNVTALTSYYGALDKQILAVTSKIRLLKEEQQKLVAANGESAVGSAQYQKLANEIESAQAQLVKLNAQMSQAKVNADKIGSEGVSSISKFKNVATSISSTFKAMSSTAKSLLNSFTNIATSFATNADTIDKASKKYGVSVEQWQRGSYIWEQLSGDANLYGSILSSLSGISANVVTENARLARTLQFLGLTFEDLKNLDSEEQLDVFMEALRSCETDAERVALATKLFGSNIGPWMAEMAVIGSSAIGEWNKELEKAGILTEKEIETGNKLDDSIKNFKLSIQKMIAESGDELLELMQGLTETGLALSPIIGAISSGLNAIGPAGTVALGVFFSMMSALPTLIVMLNSMNLAAKQYAAAIASFAALALVSSLGAAALVGLNSGKEESKLTVEYESLDEETKKISDKTSQGSTIQQTNNTDDHSVVLEDNSVNNYYITKEVDADEVIEKITDKRRGFIGG